MNVAIFTQSALDSIGLPHLPRLVKHRSLRAQGATNANPLPLTSVEQSVLDAVCDLRAGDEAYGPGDGYFGQPLKLVYKALPELSPGEILENVAELIGRDLLRGNRHNAGLVWVTRRGWQQWTAWKPSHQYLLRHEEAAE